jgi:hypothetical protein
MIFFHEGIFQGYTPVVSAPVTDMEDVDHQDYDNNVDSEEEIP